MIVPVSYVSCSCHNYRQDATKQGTVTLVVYFTFAYNFVLSMLETSTQQVKQYDTASAYQWCECEAD